MAFAAFIRTAIFNDALPGLSVRQDNTSGVAYEALAPNTVPYYVGSRVGEAENVYEVVPITDGVEIRLGPGGGTAPDVILRRNTADTLTLIGTLAGAGIIARANTFDDATVGFNVRQDGAEAAIEAVRDASNLGQPFFRAKFTSFANDLWSIQLAADGTEMYLGLGSVAPTLVMKALAAVGIFTTAATFDSRSPAANTVFFRGRLTTDAQERFQVDSTGGISLGPGGAVAPDIHLLRTAVGTLSIQDASGDPAIIDSIIEVVFGDASAQGWTIRVGDSGDETGLAFRGDPAEDLVFFITSPASAISSNAVANFQASGTFTGAFTGNQDRVLQTNSAISKTTAALTTRVDSFEGFIGAGSANDQNWSNSPVGMAAITASVSNAVGATGTVTGAAGFFWEITVISGMDHTNLYGLYLTNPAALSGSLTNLYGIFIEDLTRAATLNIGFEWSGHLRYSNAAFAFQQATTVSSTGNLTIGVAAGFDVLIGDDATILFVDGGTGTIGINTAASATRILNANTSFADPATSTFGGLFNAVITAAAGNNANVITGVTGQVEIGTASTDNWTATVGIRAISVLPVTSSGTPAGTITAAAGLYVANSQLLGTLVLTTQYGIYIENMTVGGTDYGVYIVGAGTHAIFVDSGSSRFDGAILVDGAFTIQANSATEIGIAVVSTALTIGTSGSIILPYLRAAVSIGTDTLFGNLNGAMAVLSDSGGGDTIEARVEGAWVSVALAGFLIHRQVRSWPEDAWTHPNQHQNGALDETICIICGKQMIVKDPIIQYANYDRGETDLHTVFGHPHPENDPYNIQLENRIKELEAEMTRLARV